MELDAGEGQLQIHLKTKQNQYAVPDVPYTIASNLTTADLNSFLNALLVQSNEEHAKQVDFDFLVFDEYLRGRLCDHLREKSISFENAIEIEYVERFPTPEPQDCLLHDDWVSAVKVCDKWVLTGCYDNTLNIWTIKGKHVLTIPGHTMPIKSVAWVSLDEERGRFVSCSQDQTAMLWDWLIKSNSVECVSICKGHERAIDSVDVSENQKLIATGSWDTMLKIWPTDKTENPESLAKSSKSAASTIVPKMTLQGHRECISSVQWIDNETILTGSWDHSLKIWDLNMEGIRSEITANKSVFDANYSKLNRLIITASADKNLRLYDSRTNHGTIMRQTYLGHTQWVQSVMWSTTEEYLFVSGSYDHENKLWDCRSPKAPLYDLIGHGEKVLDIDWSNPKYIVSGGADNTVRIYKSGKAVQNNDSI